jgi:hypothetical protein
LHALVSSATRTRVSSVTQVVACAHATRCCRQVYVPCVAVAQAERVHVDRVDHPARLGDDHARQRVVDDEPEEHVRRRHGGSPLPSVGRQQRRVAPDTADEGVDALLPLALIEELVDLRLRWGGLGCHGARGSVTTWKRRLHAQPRTWEVEQSCLAGTGSRLDGKLKKQPEPRSHSPHSRDGRRSPAGPRMVRQSA